MDQNLVQKLSSNQTRSIDQINNREVIKDSTEMITKMIRDDRDKTQPQDQTNCQQDIEMQIQINEKSQDRGTQQQTLTEIEANTNQSTCDQLNTTQLQAKSTESGQIAYQSSVGDHLVQNQYSQDEQEVKKQQLSPKIPTKEKTEQQKFKSSTSQKKVFSQISQSPHLQFQNKVNTQKTSNLSGQSGHKQNGFTKPVQNKAAGSALMQNDKNPNGQNVPKTRKKNVGLHNQQQQPLADTAFQNVSVPVFIKSGQNQFPLPACPSTAKVISHFVTDSVTAFVAPPQQQGVNGKMLVTQPVRSSQITKRRNPKTIKSQVSTVATATGVTSCSVTNASVKNQTVSRSRTVKPLVSSAKTPTFSACYQTPTPLKGLVGRQTGLQVTHTPQQMQRRQGIGATSDLEGLTVNTKKVDVLVIGAGPSILGMLINALKSNRFSELIQDDGLAIIDQGTCFGGGALTQYGINSNTSANGFLKCIFRKPKPTQKDQSSTPTAVSSLITQPNSKQTPKVVSRNPLNQKQSSIQKTIASSKRQESSQGVPNNQVIVGKKLMTTKLQQSTQKNKAERIQTDMKAPTDTNQDLKQKITNNLFEQSDQDTEQKELLTEPIIEQSQEPPIINLPLSDPKRSDLGQEGALLTPKKHFENILSDSKILNLTLSEKPAQLEQIDTNLDSNITVQEPQITDKNKLSIQKLAVDQIMSPKSVLPRKKSMEIGSVKKSMRFRGETSVQADRKSALPFKFQALKSKSPLSIHRNKSGFGARIQNSAQKNLKETKQEEQSGVDQKKSIEETKVVWVQEDCLTPFKELFNSNIGQYMRKMGKSIMPLSLIGHFLNYVGNHLINHAYLSGGGNVSRKIFYPRHKAISVQLLGNGEVLTQVVRTEFSIEMNPQTNSLQIVEGTSKNVQFRSKAVVIAAGARQELNPKVKTWFPDLNYKDEKKVILSDQFLKKEIFISTLNRLKSLNRPPKIVIVGGSHSGFSCAWLLLNGPASVVSGDQNQKQNKIPYAFRKQIKKCDQCCKCPQQSNLKRKEATRGQRDQSQQNKKDQMSQIGKFDVKLSQKRPTLHESSPKNLQIFQNEPIQQEAQIGASKGVTQKDVTKSKHMLQSANTLKKDQNFVPTCTCTCKCLGFFKFEEWKNEQDSSASLKLDGFQPNQIKILYREKIRVFFKSAKQALDANYKDFNWQERMEKNKAGYVYSFSGLRGDAKSLYLNIINKKEQRVELVKAQKPEDQLKHIKDADLVIFACGYQTNSIPIFDQNKRQLQLSQAIPNTQFDVDGKNRVMLSDGNVLTKVFACGVGFPVRTRDGGEGNQDKFKNPRADGFSLYMKTVGEILLKNLIPRRKLTQIKEHKEASNTWLKLATYEQVIKQGELETEKVTEVNTESQKEKDSKIDDTKSKEEKVPENQLKFQKQVDDLQTVMTEVYLKHLQSSEEFVIGLNDQSQSKQKQKPHQSSIPTQIEIDNQHMKKTSQSKQVISSPKLIATQESQDPRLALSKTLVNSDRVVFLPDINLQHTSIESLPKRKNTFLEEMNQAHELQIKGILSQKPQPMSQRKQENLNSETTGLLQRNLIEPSKLLEDCENESKSSKRSAFVTSHNTNLNFDSARLNDLGSKSPLLLQKKQQVALAQDGNDKMENSLCFSQSQNKLAKSRYNQGELVSGQQIYEGQGFKNMKKKQEIAKMVGSEQNLTSPYLCSSQYSQATARNMSGQVQKVGPLAEVAVMFAKQSKKTGIKSGKKHRQSDYLLNIKEKIQITDAINKATNVTEQKQKVRRNRLKNFGGSFEKHDTSLAPEIQKQFNLNQKLFSSKEQNVVSQGIMLKKKKDIAKSGDLVPIQRENKDLFTLNPHDYFNLGLSSSEQLQQPNSSHQPTQATYFPPIFNAEQVTLNKPKLTPECTKDKHSSLISHTVNINSFSSSDQAGYSSQSNDQTQPQKKSFCVLHSQSESMQALKRLTEAEIAIEGGVYEQINFASKSAYQSIQTVLPVDNHTSNLFTSKNATSNQPTKDDKQSEIGPKVSQVIQQSPSKKLQFEKSPSQDNDDCEYADDRFEENQSPDFRRQSLQYKSPLPQIQKNISKCDINKSANDKAQTRICENQPNISPSTPVQNLADQNQKKVLQESIQQVIAQSQQDLEMVRQKMHRHSMGHQDTPIIVATDNLSHLDISNPANSIEKETDPLSLSDLVTNVKIGEMEGKVGADSLSDLHCAQVAIDVKRSAMGPQYTHVADANKRHRKSNLSSAVKVKERRESRQMEATPVQSRIRAIKNDISRKVSGLSPILSQRASSKLPQTRDQAQFKFKRDEKSSPIGDSLTESTSQLQNSNTPSQSNFSLKSYPKKGASDYMAPTKNSQLRTSQNGSSLALGTRTPVKRNSRPMNTHQSISIYRADSRLKKQNEIEGRSSMPLSASKEQFNAGRKHLQQVKVNTKIVATHKNEDLLAVFADQQ